MVHLPPLLKRAGSCCPNALDLTSPVPVGQQRGKQKIQVRYCKLVMCCDADAEEQHLSLTELTVVIAADSQHCMSLTCSVCGQCGFAGVWVWTCSCQRRHGALLLQFTKITGCVWSPRKAKALGKGQGALSAGI
jgi:hypothetical protein